MLRSLLYTVVVMLFIILFFGSHLPLGCPSLCDPARLPHPRINVGCSICFEKIGNRLPSVWKIVRVGLRPIQWVVPYCTPLLFFSVVSTEGTAFGRISMVDTFSIFDS